MLADAVNTSNRHMHAFCLSTLLAKTPSFQLSAVSSMCILHVLGGIALIPILAHLSVSWSVCLSYVTFVSSLLPSKNTNKELGRPSDSAFSQITFALVMWHLDVIKNRPSVSLWGLHPSEIP